jgi:hypothetical protein
MEPFTRIAARFRDHAGECRTLAEQAESDDLRALLNLLAYDWDKAAELLDRLGEPPANPDAG